MTSKVAHFPPPVVITNGIQSRTFRLLNVFIWSGLAESDFSVIIVTCVSQVGTLRYSFLDTYYYLILAFEMGASFFSFEVFPCYFKPRIILWLQFFPTMKLSNVA